VGIRDTYLVEEPMAAAIGSEMPIELPRGNMVVDIGGGTTEVAIISLAATAYSESLRVAGDEVDESIVRYLQKKHQIAIGAIAAERLKLDGASVYPAEGRGNAFSVVGKDLLTGVPKNLRITSEEIREAIEEPVSAIIDAIRRALEKLPPEFASDLNESGMVLTGGGALLGGLDHRIEKETGINVYVADDPLLSVVLGAGKALEDMARYRKVFIN
jgi:rod shape-determining protein MreB